MLNILRKIRLRLPRIAALIVCAGLLCTTSGAGVDSRALADENTGVWTPNYIAAMVTDTATDMNILRAVNRDVISAELLVYESLVELDANNKPTAQLCTGWTVSADGYLWTFKIRENVSFHDGSALTANDVAETLNYIKQNNCGVWAAALRVVNSCEIVDTYTLNVKSNMPSYMLLYAMTFPVVPAGQVGAAVPAGTGPYKFVNLAAGYEMRLSANTSWWKRTATVANIQVVNFASFENALSALENGSIDAVSTRCLQASRFRSMASYYSTDYITRQFECIVPNLSSKYARDLNVRRAIITAIDRQSIISDNYLSLATEAETAIPPGDWLYDSRSEIYDYEQNTARQYLASSGWADTDGDGFVDRLNSDGETEVLSLKLITYDEPDYPTRSDVALSIANQLAEVGIKVEVDTMSYDQAKSAMNDDEFDIALVGYYTSIVPDMVWLYSSQGSGNLSGYANPEMDGYIATAQLTIDETQFQQAMKQIQQIAVADLPIIGLYFRNGVMVSGKQLLNMERITELNAYNGLEYGNYIGNK